MAGIIAGLDGPNGLRGVAPGASILPIRVAGWQPAANGRELVYARSDQLIAGLERAVDPNDDGDAHDAVRIAVTGVVEPYAAFTDGPEARAAQGALDLGTLLVAPAGNDGGAGPAFGSVAASRAGAAAVLLYGDDLPPGGLHLAEDASAPAVVVPAAAALELLAAKRAGLDVGIAVGAAHDDGNEGRGHVASFSSRGLAFDG